MPKLLIANWKSNKNRREVQDWLERFEKEMEKRVALDDVPYHIVLCAPSVFITDLSDWHQKSLVSKYVSIGLQDISSFPGGSYTGAISAPNLSGLDVTYSIVGHSERRRFFKESSQDISLKVDQCIENGITPILCVDKNEINIQANQIQSAHYKKLVVTYEPVDHIGTGVSQELPEVLKVCKTLSEAFPGAQILYGGSVNPDTIQPFVDQELIQGFLVGTASLDVDEFIDLMDM